MSKTVQAGLCLTRSETNPIDRFYHIAPHLSFRYEVLKSHIKETNEDLYKELTSREGVKVIDKKLDQSAKVGKSKRTSHHRSIYSKQVFFTGIAVLKVKKTGKIFTLMPHYENMTIYI